jgi:hypothetical protein
MVGIGGDEMKIKPDKLKGVSIITCTNRPQFFDNILNNYKMQQHKIKELIIILNNDSMNLNKYREITRSFSSIFVFKAPEKVSLGRCLNYAVGKTRYPFIAKFDDDDYYSPYYLTEQMKAITVTGADVVGKRAYLSYLEGRELLILRFPKYQNRFTSYVAGGTLLIRREVLGIVHFANVTLGEDVNFLQNCRARGYRIYAASPYNYVAIRRINKLSHTWTAGDDQLLSGSRILARSKVYRRFAIRPIKS